MNEEGERAMAMSVQEVWRTKTQGKELFGCKRLYFNDKGSHLIHNDKQLSFLTLPCL
jgi:hypothetical protein